ncbi:MAG: molecular chaperone DnaJ [Ruminococcaceae bacterium]|nr:molecular chaperone DnaJ [Oscillospiraceae bacterium]
MTDPYSILGIRPDATDEEVKQAYRELARKYHPDRYRDSDLADLASEKMKEINAAYEEIQKMRSARTSKGGASSGTRTGNSSYGHGQNTLYAEIRILINNNNIREADRRLRAIPPEERGAEWHFLTGCVLFKRGYFVDAQKLFDRACEMDPYNREYQTARDQLGRQANDPSGYRTSEQSSFNNACTCCNSLLCADCCCECMGGDLIPCC